DHACFVTQKKSEQPTLTCPLGGGAATRTHLTKDWGVVSKIAAGPGITCGIFDQSVRCFGQLDHNREYDQPFALGVGHGFGCVLDKKGVHCFGSNELGRLNPHSSLGIKEPTALAVGSFHACVIDEGKVKCWGSNNVMQASPPDDLNGPIALSAGLSHTCAIDSVGVRCWGSSQFAGSWAHGDNPYLYVSSSLHTHCRVRADRKLTCRNAPATMLEGTATHEIALHPLVLATTQLRSGFKGRRTAFDHLTKFLHRPDADFLRKLKIWDSQHPEMNPEEQELFYFLALKPYFHYSGYAMVRDEFYPQFQEVLDRRIEIHGFDRLSAFANGRSLKAYLRAGIRFLLISLSTLPPETGPDLIQSMDSAVRGLGDTLAEAEDLNQWKLSSILKFQKEVIPVVDEISKAMLDDPLLHSRAISQQVVLEFIRGI
ncbi:MAG: hypothetical protein KDD43_03950, partial [Bdellovibrionales bacterium]|nr:hypothetical protein [Bdellovibrionales bacterium]